MKRTFKMILALALALTVICALGTAAFADNATTVIKNPTDETRYVGDTAIFRASAVNYDSSEWMFLSPNGIEYNLDAFKAQFPACTVKGQGTTELRITNLQTGLNGWEVFCCFYRGSTCITTTVASIYVLIPGTAHTPATTYTTYTICDPCYVYYYEPGYYTIDGVYYYSDGTTLYVVDDEDFAPDYILADGSRVYDLSDTVTEDRESDWIELDGSRVYDLNDYEDFEPDWIELDGSRVYDLNNYELEPGFVMIDGVPVYVG